jgi:hypothetical protein
MIVLSILDVVSAHDPDLTQVRVLFPLQIFSSSAVHSVEKDDTNVKKIDFLEQFLLMMLELTDHCRQS